MPDPGHPLHDRRAVVRSFKEARRARNLGLGIIARELNCTKSLLEKYEQGVCLPSRLACYALNAWIWGYRPFIPPRRMYTQERSPRNRP